MAGPKESRIVRPSTFNRRAIGFVAASALWLSAPLSAAVSPANELDLLEVIANATPDLTTMSTAKDSLLYEADGWSVSLPATSRQPLEIGETALYLPFSEFGSSAEILGEGAVAYDNGNGSRTVPIVHRDGSVQIFTVLESASAPSQYKYSITLPTESRAALLEDGSLLVTDVDGQLVLGAAPAWAKDARGEAVPTWYEWDGMNLVQVVEHGEGSSYPIVADPWLGNDLLSAAGVRTISGGWEVWADATAWGRAYNGWAVHASHVAELKSRLGSNSWRVDWNGGTIREQFLCHVVGNAFEPGRYNMESYRPAVHWGLQLNLWDRCNPN